MHAKCRYIDIALILAEDWLLSRICSIDPRTVSELASLPMESESPLGKVCETFSQIAGGNVREWWNWLLLEAVATGDGRAALRVALALRLQEMAVCEPTQSAQDILEQLISENPADQGSAKGRAKRATARIDERRFRVLRHSDTDGEFSSFIDQAWQLPLSDESRTRLDKYVFEDQLEQHDACRIRDVDSQSQAVVNSAPALRDRERKVLKAFVTSPRGVALTVETLCADEGIRCSRSTIKRSLKKLCEQKLVKHLGRGRGYGLTTLGIEWAKKLDLS